MMVGDRGLRRSPRPQTPAAWRFSSGLLTILSIPSMRACRRESNAVIPLFLVRAAVQRPAGLTPSRPVRRAGLALGGGQPRGGVCGDVRPACGA